MIDSRGNSAVELYACPVCKRYGIFLPANLEEKEKSVSCPLCGARLEKRNPI